MKGKVGKQKTTHKNTKREKEIDRDSEGERKRKRQWETMSERGRERGRSRYWKRREIAAQSIYLSCWKQVSLSSMAPLLRIVL